MPNQAMELTETRRTTSFSMACTSSPAAQRALGLDGVNGGPLYAPLLR